MKKFVGLLLALAMMLGAAGAWAAALPNGTITRADGTEAAYCGITGAHDEHTSGADYCYEIIINSYQKLNIFTSGLTISNFDSSTIDQFNGVQIMTEGNVTLTLDNVHIACSNPVFSGVMYVKGNSWDKDLNLSLSLTNNTTIRGHTSVAIHNGRGKTNLTVTGGEGVNTISGVNYGIHIGKSEDSAAQVNTVSLGGNLIVTGGHRAFLDYPDALYINGTPEQGIRAFAGSSEQDAKPLNNGNPYREKTNVWVDQSLAGMPDVKDAQVIRTEKVSDGNNGGTGDGSLILDGELWIYQTAEALPQTGDSSSLALWGALLALAGAGMMVARKREA